MGYNWAKIIMGKLYRCPTCGNPGVKFSYVRTCKCGHIYCDGCGADSGATCPVCGRSYTEATQIGYIG
jgi:hypothetical protein